MITEREHIKMMKAYALLIIGAVWICATAGFVHNQNAVLLQNITIEPREEWRTVFGGEEYVYHFHIKTDESIRGRAVWSLSYASKTITRGECLYKAGPSNAGIIKVRLDIPIVNEGVVMPVQFALALYQKGMKKAFVSWDDTRYIFSRDAFACDKEWLKSLKIGLFDPSEQTREVFEELNIPFVLQNTIEKLHEFEGALLVVGSGVDFSKYRSLWEAIIGLSVLQHVSVLVLAPQRGTVKVPGIAHDDRILEPDTIRFARRTIKMM
ncbi:MAG: hypothetical protein ACMUJM_25955 [bacterium]